GLSPTATSNAVTRLIDRGLIRETSQVRALGRARTVPVIHAERSHPDWPMIAAAIHEVMPPMPAPGDRQRVPAHLRHAFWNIDEDTFRSLRTDSDGAFLAARAISSREPELLAW